MSTQVLIHTRVGALAVTIPGCQDISGYENGHSQVRFPVCPAVTSLGLKFYVLKGDTQGQFSKGGGISQSPCMRVPAAPQTS